MSLNKDVSKIQEAAVAAKLGGTLTPGSGAAQFYGGDVLTADFLIECKTTTKAQTSFSIKEEWLKKAKEQAFEQRKYNYALAFRFDPTGPDFIVMPIDTFKYLIEEKD